MNKRAKKKAAARWQPRCRYCGRPLRNIRSVWNGCGPGCYKKELAKLEQTVLVL